MGGRHCKLGGMLADAFPLLSKIESPADLRALPRADLAHRGRQPAQVIFVAVGEQDQVQRPMGVAGQEPEQVGR